MKACVLRSYAVAGIVAAFAPVALCQAATASQTGPCQVNSSAPAHLHPYTAEFKVTQVQTLSGGTTITHVSKEISARDSQGRIFHQATQNAMSVIDESTEYTMGYVDNAADGIQIHWNSQSKRATVIKMPTGSQRQGCWKSEFGTHRMNFETRLPPNVQTAAKASAKPPAAPNPVNPLHVEHEDLGTATIQGVEARGTRVTTTTPVGRVGNDRPLVSTIEQWGSRELGIELRGVANDPQQGKRTRELVSLTQGEPDPALFQPPEGYEVVSEEMHQVPCDHP